MTKIKTSVCFPVVQLNNVPNRKHYAVLRINQESYYRPADGHGYPAGYETRTKTEYYVAHSQEKLKSIIEGMTPDTFRVFEVQPMQVVTSFNVEFKS